MILSSHITHRLQSLDVSLFALLTRYYINDFNAMMNNSFEMMSMSKKAFWSVFWSVWQQVFIAKNIASDFEKTDIILFDSDTILNQIIKKKLRASTSENIDDSQTSKTFMTDRAVRRMQKVYENQSNRVLLFKIFTVNQRLAVKDSINQHVIRDLLDALKNEKKRRNRDKKLNLLNEQNSRSQFFSSDRMQTIKIYQAAKDEEKSRKQENIAEKRAQIIANKILKNKEKQKRVLIAAKKRQFNAKRRKIKKIEKQIQKKLKFAASKLKQLIVRLKLSFTDSKQTNNDEMQAQKTINETVIPGENEDAISITSRERRMRASRQFDA